MSGCLTHSIPQAGARPQRTETSTPWGQASIIPRECDGGVGGVGCGIQSQAFQTCLAAQPMALHKPAQDHREKRHPHHEGKPVYYPENVVEVLEIEFYCDRGEGGTMRLVDRHMATAEALEVVEVLEVAEVLVVSQFYIAGEKAAEVLEVDQFYIAGDADTESKQFKPEDI
ncbi:hypothetical protein B0H14DRAFT_2623072 [Mycena olivaceomarginata]|nr:hypothetical protein B0H14DRAFT_2623072 [Mycena olivaceomarginata]